MWPWYNAFRRGSVQARGLPQSGPACPWRRQVAGRGAGESLRQIRVSRVGSGASGIARVRGGPPARRPAHCPARCPAQCMNHAAIRTRRRSGSKPARLELCRFSSLRRLTLRLAAAPGPGERGAHRRTTPLQPGSEHLDGAGAASACRGQPAVRPGRGFGRAVAALPAPDAAGTPKRRQVSQVPAAAAGHGSRARSPGSRRQAGCRVRQHGKGPGRPA